MLSVLKAAEHFHNDAKTWMKKQPAVTADISNNPTRLNFIRPVVVLDGELLAAEVDKAGKLLVSEIAMAPMYVGYKSSKYSCEWYRVDLVKLSALGNYPGFAEKQHDAVRKAILELGGLDGFSDKEIYGGAKPKKLSRASKKK